MAKRLGRRFIGIEQNPGYVSLARSRIEQVIVSAPSDLEVTGSKKDEPRIPFGQIVEAGYLHPGDEVFCPKGRTRAKVRADGSLAIGDAHRLDPQAGRHGAVRRPPATAGPTGTSAPTRGCGRSMCCAPRRGRTGRPS